MQRIQDALAYLNGLCTRFEFLTFFKYSNISRLTKIFWNSPLHEMHFDHFVEKSQSQNFVLLYFCGRLSFFISYSMLKLSWISSTLLNVDSLVRSAIPEITTNADRGSLAASRRCAMNWRWQPWAATVSSGELRWAPVSHGPVEAPPARSWQQELLLPALQPCPPLTPGQTDITSGLPTRPSHISVNILCHDVEKNSSGQKNAPNPHNFGAKIPGDSTAL